MGQTFTMITLMQIKRHLWTHFIYLQFTWFSHDALEEKYLQLQDLKVVNGNFKGGKK